ncbi:hypothetical protein HSTV2_61 [Halorubrum sodomense tailed virus 2]|uniref:Helix-turn-helix type 11 domain-containing protein n=1 Tax=Halorubrum sodomense tailed virus 2 TaxID=1262527 RepID=L7TK23_9CAUD|nr:exonuclease [Halorubrum sodomense tailed virus 2]AGC34330.1 hypothetical protein HSTV2_61 [Halorubrum sodomense tailed virus 2]
MRTIAELRESEQNVLTLLDEPTTYAELAEILNISESTARDHVAAIRRTGIPLGEDTGENGAKLIYRSEETQESLERRRPAPMSSKASHTKSKREILNELRDWLAEDLTGRAVIPDSPPPARDSHEDMVVHRSDDHAGAWYVNDGEENAYDAEIFAQRVRAVNDRTFRLKERQEAAGVNFDTFHLLLGGDGVHGEGIHGNQPWETELDLVEQISLWVDLYTEFIDRASDEFPHVQIVCQRGNHGELRGDGMSPDANADDICYMMLEKRILDRGYDNISLIWRRGGGYYTNFRMRVDEQEDQRRADALGLDSVSDLPPEYQTGHRGHLRHGQKSLFHIGTSSGQNKWRHWMHDRHKADIGYRGHYHEFRLEHIDSKPVLMSGSICPPDDFEEGLAAWSEPAATVHGVSDERPVTWLYPIDFQ